MSDFFATPRTVAHQAFLSRLPFPSPGDLLDPGVKLTLPALQADSSPLNRQEAPTLILILIQITLLKEAGIYQGEKERQILGHLKEARDPPKSEQSLAASAEGRVQAPRET